MKIFLQSKHIWVYFLSCVAEGDRIELNFSNVIFLLSYSDASLCAYVDNGLVLGCELINASAKKCATRSHKIYVYIRLLWTPAHIWTPIHTWEM